MGRPRKSLAARKPSGRITQTKKEDPRYEVGEVRMRKFGVTKAQSISPYAGYLAGVLFLRGKLTVKDLGHYFSFLQIIPRGGSRAIVLKERVQGGRFHMPEVGSKVYAMLVRSMGRDDIHVLHELTHDRQVCPVKQLKLALAKVPLTRAGSEFIMACEMQHPRNR